MFEVRWNKPFATNFFGRFVQAGGLMNVPAQLAIKLHESKEGWVCDEILKARASLEAGNTKIDGVLVSIDDVPPAGTPVTVEIGGETVKGEIAAEHPQGDVPVVTTDAAVIVDAPVQGELVGPAEEAIITPTPELRPAQETVAAPVEGDAPAPDAEEKPASPAVKAAKAEAAKNRRNKNNPK